jgi:hypothetical protein
MNFAKNLDHIVDDNKMDIPRTNAAIQLAYSSSNVTPVYPQACFNCLVLEPKKLELELNQVTQERDKLKKRLDHLSEQVIRIYQSAWSVIKNCGWNGSK